MEPELFFLPVVLVLFAVVWLTPRESWLGRAIDALQGGDCDCEEHRK